jgi:hypothetical protein
MFRRGGPRVRPNRRYSQSLDPMFKLFFTIPTNGRTQWFDYAHHPELVEGGPPLHFLSLGFADLLKTLK